MSVQLLTNEATLAERLGVARAILRDLRKNGAVREGEHWVRGENQAVEYTAAGAAELVRTLAPDSPVEVIEELETAPTHVELYVQRTVRNHRLVLAVRTLEELRSPRPSLLRVQVKNSKKMRPGMLLDRCRHVSADLYTFEGRKPRLAPITAPIGPETKNETQQQ
jgi:hypothetical protein